MAHRSLRGLPRPEVGGPVRPTGAVAPSRSAGHAVRPSQVGERCLDGCSWKAEKTNRRPAYPHLRWVACRWSACSSSPRPPPHRKAGPPAGAGPKPPDPPSTPTLLHVPVSGRQRPLTGFRKWTGRPACVRRKPYADGVRRTVYGTCVPIAVPRAGAVGRPCPAVPALLRDFNHVLAERILLLRPTGWIVLNTHFPVNG